MQRRGSHLMQSERRSSRLSEHLSAGTGRIGVSGSPRRSCRPRHQGRGGAILGIDPALDRGCLPRRYQPGRRGKPQRRAHGLAAGGPPRVRAGPDGGNRLRASGLEAVNIAARMIEASHGDVFIAGGVESMSQHLMCSARRKLRSAWSQIFDTSIGWRLVSPRLAALHHPSPWARPPRMPASTRSAGRIRISSRCRASNGGCRRTNEGRPAQRDRPVEIPGSARAL